MTTVREQAREAAVRGRTSTTWTHARDAADAASDVWEPIVRGLLAELEDSGCSECGDPRLSTAYTRAKEALDG